LYPLVLDALGLGKISVGPPYFETVFVPLMAPLVFLMGVGPIARWKESALPDLATRLRWAAGVAVVSALITGWLAGHIGWMSSLGLLLAFWVVASVATDFIERIKPKHGVSDAAANWLGRMRLIPRAMVGMMVAHLGIAVFIIGVTMVGTFQVERDLKMAPGETVEVRGWTFTFRGVKPGQGPNYEATIGAIDVSRDGQLVHQMRPEKRVYRVQQNPMTEAAIHTRLSGDLYVSLGEPVGDNAWIVRVYVKPFISWIWFGCVVMALGGLLAATDRRYRSAKRVAQSSALGTAA
jgi:cytochrome c-type biogenesis protein CcmF